MSTEVRCTMSHALNPSTEQTCCAVLPTMQQALSCLQDGIAVSTNNVY
jgi:hypothetical protein